MKRVPSISLILILGLAQCTLADITFPCPVEIKTPSANIRTQPTTNHEAVAKASRGDLLLAWSEKYGWYEVDLPVWAEVWIHESLVELLPLEGSPIGEDLSRSAPTPPLTEARETPQLVDLSRFGRITKDRVNLRSKPGQPHTTIGQCNAGATVRCVARYGDWIKVTAPFGKRGWVHGQIVEPLSQDALGPPVLEAITKRDQLFLSGVVDEDGLVTNMAAVPIASVEAALLPREIIQSRTIYAGRFEWTPDPLAPPQFLLQCLQAAPVPVEVEEE